MGRIASGSCPSPKTWTHHIATSRVNFGRFCFKICVRCTGLEEVEGMRERARMGPSDRSLIMIAKSSALAQASSRAVYIL
jgi:hypothetical protein